MLTARVRLLYFWETRTRIEHAQRAWVEASAALDAGDVDTFWYCMEGFLTATIGVANLLWPSQTSRGQEDRAADLRAQLGAARNAPAGLRDVRNGFEHFDERIDAWAKISVAHNFVDTFIGSASGIQGVSSEDFARQYDPATRELSVFGKSTSVDAVLAEISAIYTALPHRI